MRRRGERGFTLVELLVAVSILGIVGSSLFGAIFVGLKTYSQSNEQLNESNDRQSLGIYVTRDVQDSVAIATSGGTCGSTGVVVMRLTWTEIPTAAGAAVPREVSYRFVSAVAPAFGSISRNLCLNGVLVSTVTVASWVSAASSTCLTALLAVDPTCPATSRGARLSVTDYGPSAFTVDGVRRTE